MISPKAPSRRKNLMLRRYSSLPILLDMLARKRITLVSPSLWEDRSDAYFLERYREKKRLKTVLAFCVTTKQESFHHWKVFAGSSSGVCVRFVAERLLACLRGKPGVSMGYVSYLTTKDLEQNRPSLDELPFLKRRQFADEQEFRFIYGRQQCIGIEGLPAGPQFHIPGHIESLAAAFRVRVASRCNPRTARVLIHDSQNVECG